MDNSKCLCGSGKPSVDCCIQYIETPIAAHTPEELMRSRYVAFATGKVDYILGTERLAKKNTAEDMQAWCESTTWEKLEILESTEDGDKGTVSFVAHYNNMVQPSVLRENSQFEKVNGHWFYTGGDATFEKLPMVSNKEVGRNDPCTCGSGKKYKKCCG